MSDESRNLRRYREMIRKETISPAELRELKETVNALVKVAGDSARYDQMERAVSELEATAAAGKD